MTEQKFTAPKTGRYRYGTALEALGLPDGSVTVLPDDAWSTLPLTAPNADSKKDEA